MSALTGKYQSLWLGVSWGQGGARNFLSLQSDKNSYQKGLSVKLGERIKFPLFFHLFIGCVDRSPFHLLNMRAFNAGPLQHHTIIRINISTASIIKQPVTALLFNQLYTFHKHSSKESGADLLFLGFPQHALPDGPDGGDILASCGVAVGLDHSG